MNCDKKVFLLAACVCGVLALTTGARGDYPGDIAADVKVGPPQTQVVAGFGEFEGVQMLYLKMSPNDGYKIVGSECMDYPGEYMTTQTAYGDDLHTWLIVGVLPNFVTIQGLNYQESHSSIFRGTVVEAGGGGGGGTPESIPFYTHVCEVDLDGDTDNDSTAAHRPPSGNAAEDIAEYEQALEVCIGLLLPVNDDNDAGWDKRDGDTSGTNFDYEEDNELLDLELKINPKKRGNFYIGGSFGWLIYDVDGIRAGIPEWSRYVSGEHGWSKDMSISGGGGGQGIDSGYLGNVHVWFETFTLKNEQEPADNLRFLLIGTDIDVNSDNKSSGDPPTLIDDINIWNGGEDFYENHGSYAVSGGRNKPEFQYGLLLPVNDDDDDCNGHPDNGWDGEDWDGPDHAHVVTGEDDLRVLKLRALDLDEDHWWAIDDMDGTPMIRLGKIGGTGGVRVFTTEETPQEILFGVGEGEVWQFELPDSTTLWDKLKGKHDGLTLHVEGVKAGNVVMQVELYIERTGGDLVLHRDTILITVIDASLTLYKRDETTKVTRKNYPGARLACNNDDDDADETEDWSDTNGVAGEDDLVKAVFEFGAFFDGLEFGKVIVERSNAKIKLWKQKTKGSGQEITFANNKNEYDLTIEADRTAFAADIKDKTLWVEGWDGSSALNDTELKLTYEATGGGSVIDDPTKITVFDSELMVYPGDGTTVLGLHEEADPGAYVWYNRDDDDGDDMEDQWDDSVAGEDDMCKVRFFFDSLFYTLSVGKVVIERSSDSIRLWKAQAKGAGQEIDFGDNNRKVYDLSVEAQRTAFQTNIRNKYLYVEGYTTSSELKDTELKLVYEDGDTTSKTVCEDPVKFTVLRVDATHIAFNADRSAHTSDGINIRKHFTGGAAHKITAPEWQVDAANEYDPDDDDTDDEKNDPALFKRNTRISVWVRFTVTPELTSAKIRGKAVGSPSIGNLGAVQDVTVSWKPVTFSSGVSNGSPIGGVDGFVAFTPKNATSSNIYYDDAEWQWRISEINGEGIAAMNFTVSGQKTDKKIRLYTIWGTAPADMWPWTTTDTGGDDNQQPWANALKFAFETASMHNKHDYDAIAQLTNYLHSGHGLLYDVPTWGVPKYCLDIPATTDKIMHLTNYINKTSGVIVNCSDQAAAIVSLSRLIGIRGRYRRIGGVRAGKEFGYIPESNLVGRGTTNSPFWLAHTPNWKKIAPADSLRATPWPDGRDPFVFHAVVECTTSGGETRTNRIYDATVGPYTGGMGMSTYYEAAHDDSSAGEEAIDSDLPDDLRNRNVSKLK